MPEIVGGEFVGGGVVVRARTVMRNGPTERVSRPSLTLIVMSPVSPTLASPGVPVSAPVSALNAAHVGLPSIVNSRKSSSASEALGVNEYIWPAVTVGAGVPPISGALLAGGGGGSLVGCSVGWASS